MEMMCYRLPGSVVECGEKCPGARQDLGPS